MSAEVKNLDNKKVNDIKLPAEIFSVDVRSDLLNRTVNWQLAKRHQGTHKTKTISEISGTTKKPFRQKGTGNARQGSLRSAQMRGGATTFGPLPRSHAHALPKKVRRFALKSALSMKAARGTLIVLDSLSLTSGKTKDFLKRIEGLQIGNALVVDGKNIDQNFKKAVSNLHTLNVLPVEGLNVYDIIRHEKLVLTINAVKELELRLK